MTWAEARACRACGKELLFAEGPNGKAIPLDLSAPVYRVLPNGTCARETGCYVTHFASCPEASRFSKGGKEKK